MNLLKETPDYQITQTVNGVWRRYLYPNATLYSEFISHRSVGGWPLVHITNGRSPETGKVTTARGIIAIGLKAVGVVAIGRKAVGVVAIGQAAAGVIVLGQAAVGIVTIGQAAVGIIAIGQAAAGLVAIGQSALGVYGYAQFGLGPSTLHLWGQPHR